MFTKDILIFHLIDLESGVGLGLGLSFILSTLKVGEISIRVRLCGLRLCRLRLCGLRVCGSRLRLGLGLGLGFEGSEGSGLLLASPIDVFTYRIQDSRFKIQDSPLQLTSLRIRCAAAKGRK